MVPEDCKPPTVLIPTCLYFYYYNSQHNDVIKWKHFPRYWPFVRGIHRSPVNPPHKGQWRGALVYSLICIWINGWVNRLETGDLRRYRAHYDVTVNGTPTGETWGEHGDIWPILMGELGSDVIRSAKCLNYIGNVARKYMLTLRSNGLLFLYIPLWKPCLILKSKHRVYPIHYVHNLVAHTHTHIYM